MRALGVEGDEEWEEAAEVEIRNIAEKRKFLSEIMKFFRWAKWIFRVKAPFQNVPKASGCRSLRRRTKY